VSQGLENMHVIGKLSKEQIDSLHDAPGMVIEVDNKSFLFFNFPDDKKKIAHLSYDQKMEWYAHQFQKNPGVYPVHLVGTEFERFWKWRVLIPMKFKRFYFRMKNLEVFKRYPHITEIKKKREKPGPELI